MRFLLFNQRVTNFEGAFSKKNFFIINKSLLRRFRNSFFQKSVSKFSLNTLIISLLLFCGCAGTVVETMNEAHSAIESAKKAGAELYAPDELMVAEANYELAMQHFLQDEANYNRLVIVLAKKALESARMAEYRARAFSSAQTAIAPAIITTPEAEEDIAPPEVEEDEDLVVKRYLAVAQRRVRTVALIKAGANPPEGLVEIELWIAPDGQITQLLIVRGNPDDLLTRTIIHGLQGFRLEPFPKGIKQNYLKLRVTIDTRKR